MWSEYLRRISRSFAAGQQLVLLGAQVQHDVGAARRPLDGLDGVLAFAAALPPHAVLGRQPGAARRQRHPSATMNAE